MSEKSFIYRSIFIYRFIMNLLYLGRYRKRFNVVIQQIKLLPSGASILELCFGDVYIAEFCKKAGYHWKGLDINKHFVKTAQQMGFDADYADLEALEVFPKGDACIMMGSLYHFHSNTAAILSKMLQATDNIIISEPVSNLSSNQGLLGFLARRAANAGKGNETFRYDKSSFMAMIDANSKPLGYDRTIIEEQGKDLVVKLIKNEKT